MKNLLAAVSGFLLTLSLFGGGALTAIYLIDAEPSSTQALDMETNALWTNKAVSVSNDSVGLNRIPARPVPQQPQERQEREPVASEAIENTTTAAIGAPPQQTETTASHVEWCSQQYRSYDPVNNSYNAHSGVRRKCVSPYSDEQWAEEAQIISASAGSGAFVAGAQAGEMGSTEMAPDHIRSCFDRYRSYTPQDNTYQPYGGGPRRQCE